MWPVSWVQPLLPVFCSPSSDNGTGKIQLKKKRRTSIRLFFIFICPFFRTTVTFITARQFICRKPPSWSQHKLTGRKRLYGYPVIDTDPRFPDARLHSSDNHSKERPKQRRAEAKKGRSKEQPKPDRTTTMITLRKGRTRGTADRRVPEHRLRHVPGCR